MLLISSPAKAWEEIRLEENSQNVMSGFVYPLIGLCGLAVFLGSLSFGFGMESLRMVLTEVSAMVISLFLGYFVAVYLVNGVTAAMLGRESRMLQSQLLVGYGLSVIMVLNIVLGLFPSFFLIYWLLQFYIMYIVWEGANKLMEVPEQKMMFYSIVVSAILILVPFIIRKVFNFLSATMG